MEIPSDQGESPRLEQIGQLLAMVWVTKWSLSLPLIIAVVTDIFWGFGGRVDPAFYSTIAQIAPVLLLTMLLSELYMLRRFVEEVVKDERDTRTRILSEVIVNQFFALFAAVELPALIAVALGHSTTFLLTWTSLALVALALAFRRNQAEHYMVSTRGQGSDGVSAEPS